MEAFKEYTIYFALVLIILALLVAFWRFIKGPTAADRTVAVDTLTTIGIAALVLLGYLYQRFIYIDVALVYGVLGFIGVLVIARYLEDAL